MPRAALLILGLLLISLTLTGCLTGTSDDEPQELFSESNSTMLEQHADELLAQGKLEEAYLNYGKALIANPKNYQAKLKRGDILLRRGLGDQALVEYLTLIKEIPDSQEAARAHLGCGQILFAAGMTEQSLRHFDFAMEISPQLWMATLYKGIVFNLDQKHKQAEMAFLTVLEHDPDNGDALNNLGLTYAMTGRYNDAVSVYRRALAAGAEKNRVSNNLGLAFYRLGRMDEALEAFRAGPTWEEEAVAHNNLGYCYLVDGKNKEAVAQLEKAMELAPKFYVRAHENFKKAKTALAFEEQRKEDPNFSRGAFTLVLGSHKTLSQALFQQENLQQMGIETRILPASYPLNGPPIQVVTGEYDSLPQAREAQKALEAQFGLASTSIRSL